MKWRVNCARAFEDGERTAAPVCADRQPLAPPPGGRVGRALQPRRGPCVTGTHTTLAAGGTPSPKETGSRWPRSQQTTKHLCSPFLTWGTGFGPLCEQDGRTQLRAVHTGQQHTPGPPSAHTSSEKTPQSADRRPPGHRVTAQPMRTDSRLREAEPLKPVLLFVPRPLAQRCAPWGWATTPRQHQPPDKHVLRGPR